MNPSPQRFRVNICNIFSSMLSECVHFSACLEFIIYIPLILNRRGMTFPSFNQGGKSLPQSVTTAQGSLSQSSDGLGQNKG